jgi:putative tryptophan/tyrosine transport system substrate-binding protein
VKREANASARTEIIGRRKLIAMLGGTAVVWPVAALAQQQLPVIGFLSARSASSSRGYIEPFKRGLAEGGYTDGKNVVVEYRFADGRYDTLPGLANDLVGRRVSVILTAGGPPPAHAALAATSSIPIVFVVGDDPVAEGLVESIARPGGSVTGVMLLTGMLIAKVVEVLHDLLPKVANPAVLVNPTFPYNEDDIKQTQAAVHHFGLGLTIARAGNRDEIDQAFASMRQSRPDALVVISEPFLNSAADIIAARALAQSLPTIFGLRDGPAAGGLASYGPSFDEAYREAGGYAARILKGDEPVDLPVLQPETFDLVINLKTAKALGLTISREMLLRATEVIE